MIASTTVLANETTMANFSTGTQLNLVRATQCVLKLTATFSATTDDGLIIYLYPSADNVTYDDKYWYRWTIPHCIQVGYDAGQTEFCIGETITATSGGTGTVIGWTVTGGSWTGNDAAGVLYLESPSGTLANNDTLTGGISGLATQDGAAAAHTIQRHSTPISSAPLYMKAMIANNGSQSATSVALTGTVWSL
ncbi:MAG: hypothetical protein WC657_05590 [Candidatus Paceibacterota bacterium]|jgi:hypothetical protein